METEQTKAKLANAIRDLQAKGDTATIERLVSAYKTKYRNGGVKAEPEAFTFAIPEVVETQASKLGRLQSEAKTAQAESKKANSFLGKAGNFGKALVENIAPSQVGLGRTIAKINNQSGTYSKLIQDVSSQQVNLLKAIREKEAKGGDTTSLKRIYNDNTKQLSELNKDLAEETNLPSFGKVAGQLGGTALDLLTAGTYGKATQGAKTLKLSPSKSSLVKKTSTAVGLPELGKIAEQKAKGLFTTKGLANVGKGAGIGYASDVTMGLQGLRGEDREGAKALIPGLGTAIGTTLPLINEGTQTVKNLTNPEIKAQKLVEKRAKGLEKLDSYQTLKKATEKGRERGIDIKKVLSETDVLHGSVDNTGTITTKGDGGAVEQYTKQFIDGNESIVSDLLKKENRSISPALVKARLIQKVKSAGIEGAALTKALKSIDDEVAGYVLRAGDTGNIPVATLHDAKIDKYNNINFFTEGNVKKYDKTIAKALKELVEESTTSVKIKEINDELSKHFAVIDYLNKLDNKKVSGGKLGKYFAQTVGAIVGSKAGPLGAIVGAEVGGNIKGNLMSRAFSGKTGKIQPQAKAITNALKVKNAPPLELPQSKSNNLGSLKTNQSTTIMNTNIAGIPKSSNKPIKKSIPNKQGGFIKVGQDAKAPIATQSNQINANTASTSKNVIPKTIPQSPEISKSIQKAKASGQSLPISKTEFVEKTKGQFNSIREVGGYKVRARMYDNNPWQIVDDVAEIGDGESFRTAKTIKEFKTREDLWKYVKDNPKGQDLDLVKAKEAILQSPTLSKTEIETIKSAKSFDEIWNIVKTKGADTQGMFTTRLQTAFKDNSIKTRSQLKAEWDKVKSIGKLKKK